MRARTTSCKASAVAAIVDALTADAAPADALPEVVRAPNSHAH